MNNRCLIIMPQGEPAGYPQGHISRVYDFIIVPACRMAGYWPARADNASHADPLEAVKEMIDSEIVLCDISAENSHALYAWAIRQGLGLPVTIVKDMKSVTPLGAGESGVVEYDESLRIDTVQKTIELLSEAMKSAVENKKEKYELLTRLGIGVPKVEITPFPEPSSVVEEEKKEEKPKEPRLPIISPLPDYVGEPFTEAQLEKLKSGDSLFHLNHGKGKVNFVKQSGKEKLASIQFDSGTMLLVISASDFFRRVQ